MENLKNQEQFFFKEYFQMLKNGGNPANVLRLTA